MSAGVDLHELRPRPHGALAELARFDLRLTCRTGLHVGAGRSSELVGSDLPVLRDAAGRPLVPGSSLRGVLRAGIEAVCASLDLDRVRAAVAADPAAAVQDPLAAAWPGLSLVERLFGVAAGEPGGLSYASRLKISDLACEGDAAPRCEVRDGVALRRETRTAAHGARFDLEVVPAGTRFRGRVRLASPADYELGLVAQALWMLDEGMLLLGGKTARGLGWVAVEVTPVRRLAAADLLAPATVERAADDFAPVATALAPHLESLRQLAAAAGGGE